MFKEITKHEQLSGKKLGVSISVQLDRMPTKDEIKREKKDILALFPSLIHVKEIENGYSKQLINPWYVVTTSKGPITIGWRKRVINIDWEHSDIKEWASELFPDEDVTKNGSSIHAWGYEKAKEYITKLLNL